MGNMALLWGGYGIFSDLLIVFRFPGLQAHIWDKICLWRRVEFAFNLTKPNLTKPNLTLVPEFHQSRLQCKSGTKTRFFPALPWEIPCFLLGQTLFSQLFLLNADKIHCFMLAKFSFGWHQSFTSHVYSVVKIFVIRTIKTTTKNMSDLVIVATWRLLYVQ